MNNYKENKAKFGTHRLVANMIEKNECVLDVGCNKGYLKQNCHDSNEFYGIDSDEKALILAKQRGYNDVTCLNLDNVEKVKEFVENENCKFDVIVFADILEHLVNRSKVLNLFVQKLLKHDGKVIVSLPNVAHISIRIKLLFGDFTYYDSGILDRTHVHLFTSKTAKDFLNREGLYVRREKFSSNRFGWLINIIPVLGTLLGYNLIYVCEK